ncbi:hypothetical protein [Mucilaginibacter flavus]|uniref:hypothetical protein n=1 Tax=Mucilaginibacter flavus TaxID=931504 RepID=UPI0025B42950|nr:hypothetical protein [Mucilaginibacter flavus]MDN3584611.1 hypothetical protein [Mucilaginibacter flavus]
MNNFLITLKFRNEPLFYFGWCCLISAIVFLGATRVSQMQVTGANAFYKPFKFALSIGIFSWTMGWFCWYLRLPGQVNGYSWALIVLLGFELFYIAFQASRGQLSHYNRSTPVYALILGIMALAAVGITLYTAYIGVLFCTRSFPELPEYYIWSIRLGIFLFVIFALEGLVMGARGSHTVGGPDGGGGLPVLNWTRKLGDLRIAHFVGMHALQIIPLVSYYGLKNVKFTFLLAAIYSFVAILILVQALNGRPFFK